MTHNLLKIIILFFHELTSLLVSGISTKDVNMKNVLQEVQKFEVQKHPDVAKWMAECEETVGREDWRIIKV